jgi:hypothetical protein
MWGRIMAKKMLEKRASNTVLGFIRWSILELLRKQTFVIH